MTCGHYFFIGTVAELIKMAPVIREFRNRDIPFRIISSGQNNWDDVGTLKLAGISGPDLELSSPPRRQTATGLFFWFIETFLKGVFSLRKEFRANGNEAASMIVHGDTVSTVMGALLGRIFGLRVAHVEAGLRSFNWLSPFPEELDRLMVSRLAAVHFCPGEWALNNLSSISGRKIDTGYNTLIDSLALAKQEEISSSLLEKLKPKPYFVLVLHRQENLFDRELLKKLLDLARNKARELRCVFVIHKPTRVALEKYGMLAEIESDQNITCSDRLSYVEFMKLLCGAEFLMTDGGSNQEECFYLGLPCVIMRKETERKEGIGANCVISENNFSQIEYFLKNYSVYRKEPQKPKSSPSSIIVNVISDCYTLNKL